MWCRLLRNVRSRDLGGRRLSRRLAYIYRAKRVGSNRRCAARNREHRSHALFSRIDSATSSRLNREAPLVSLSRQLGVHVERGRARQNCVGSTFNSSLPQKGVVRVVSNPAAFALQFHAGITSCRSYVCGPSLSRAGRGVHSPQGLRCPNHATAAVSPFVAPPALVAGRRMHRCVPAKAFFFFGRMASGVRVSDAQDA